MSSYTIYTINSTCDMSQNGLDGFQYYYIDASSGNITVTLTSNCFTGSYYPFMRVDSSSNTVTFIPSSSAITINSKTSLILPINTECDMIFSNNNWTAPKFSYSM